MKKDMKVKKIGYFVIGVITGFIIYPMTILTMKFVQTRIYYMQISDKPYSVCRDFEPDESDRVISELSGILVPYTFSGDIDIEGSIYNKLHLLRLEINEDKEFYDEFIYKSNVDPIETQKQIGQTLKSFGYNSSLVLQNSSDQYPADATKLQVEEELPFCESSLSIRQINIAQEDSDTIVLVVVRINRSIR